MKSSSRCSITTPATISTSPPTHSTGTDSRRICHSCSRPDRHAHTSAAAAPMALAMATSGVSAVMPTRYVARKSAGSVTTSPTAEMRGALTLSRSQPRRVELAARPSVTTSTTIEASSAPITDTTMRSVMPMMPDSPNSGASTLVITPRATAVTSVSTAAAMTFWPTMVSRRAVARKVPA